MKQAGPLEGDGRVGGENREELDLGGREGMRLEVVADEHAVDGVAAGDRHREIGAGRLRTDEGARRRGVLERGVGLTIPRPHGAPLGEGAARDAFPGPEHEVPAQLGIEVEPPPEDQPAPRLVVGVDARGVAAQEIERRLRDPVQDPVEIEGRGKLPRDLVELGGLARLALGRGVEPRAPQERPGLPSDRLEDGELRVVEPAALFPPDEVKRARDLIVEDERDDQSRLVRERTEEREGEARIMRDIVAPGDLPGLEDGLPESLLGERHGARRDDLEQVPGHVIGGNRIELGSLRVDQVGGHGPGARQACQLPAHAPERLGKVQGPADDLRDRQERCRLAEPRLQSALGGGQPSEHRLEGTRQLRDLRGAALGNLPCRVARRDGAGRVAESREGAGQVGRDGDGQCHRRQEGERRPAQQAPVRRVQVGFDLGVGLAHPDLPSDIGHGREARQTPVAEHARVPRNLAGISGRDDRPDR